MSDTVEIPVLVFPSGFTERDEWEMERKGFAYAFFQFKDGRRYSAMLINPVRLAQDVEATINSGQSYYYEPGQVVVSDVTIAVINKIIPDLVTEGFFNRHQPTG
ncbi:MAG: hypothetical protein V4719_15970 [Planctomycetota bacterium]